MAVPDNTYPLGGTGIYREQGGQRLVVGTSGEIVLGSTSITMFNSTEIKLGASGKITLGSSDVVTLTSTGIVHGTSSVTAISSGAQTIEAITASVTTASIPAMGVSTVAATTAAGAQVFNLAAPITGQRKRIMCTVANATDTCTIFAGTNVGINNTGTAASQNRYRFVAPGVVDLIGGSTVAYLICTPNVSTVAYSTS